MKKENITEIKKSVKENILNKNLVLSSAIMFFMAVINLFFLILVLFYVYIIFDFNMPFNIVPAPFMVEAKNSYKLLFIIFLCPIITLLYLTVSFLKLGIKRWFYLLTKDKTASFLQIFYYYGGKSKMMEVLMMKGTILMKVLADTLIFLVPGTALFLFSSIKMQTASQDNKIVFAGLMVASAVIFAIGFLIFTKKLLIYKLYKILFFSGNTKSINQDIKKIKFILERNKLDNFKFLFSFIIHFLSCFLIVPATVMLPYLKMAGYMYLERTINENDKKPCKAKTKLFYVNIN